jgi:hypothetical protein
MIEDAIIKHEAEHTKLIEALKARLSTNAVEAR